MQGKSRFSMGSEGQEKTLLPWGDTQTGKTSLIPAAVHNDPGAISRIQGHETLAAKYSENETVDKSANEAIWGAWNALRRSCFPHSTAINKLDFTIKIAENHRLHVRDIFGGVTTDKHWQDGIFGIIQPADAIFFIVELGSSKLLEQLLAIDKIWHYCEKLQKALVFTKCEIVLDSRHPAWMHKEGWWRSIDFLGARADVIGRFGANVWATSVFGYHRKTLEPNITLGEFGEIRPISISPWGVAEPFSWIVENLFDR